MSEATVEIRPTEESQDTNIESTLHRLLSGSDDPFGDDDAAELFGSDGDDDNNSLSTEPVHTPNEIEKAMASVIAHIQSNDMIDTELLNDKQLSLDAILGEGSHVDADLDMGNFLGDFQPQGKRPLEDDEPGTNQNDEQIKRPKVQKTIKEIRIFKKTNEPFMSPASLSPSSSTSPANSDAPIKLDSIALTNLQQEKSLVVPKKTSIVVPEKVQLVVPEKNTNEFTMHQVADVKKRIINTHKLILNFNFLKDGYARTCVELKKAMSCLKDSELHRAHLMAENEHLKRKLAALSNPIKEEP